MLTNIIPKLPMRDKKATLDYYIRQLGFSVIDDYGDYLLVEKDQIEIHFFAFKDLVPEENYGQVYIQTHEIHQIYQKFVDDGVAIHPNAPLQTKPWGQIEFSLLDPDHNLLTFGQSLS